MEVQKSGINEYSKSVLASNVRASQETYSKKLNINKESRTSESLNNDLILEQNKHEIDEILPKLPFQTTYFDSNNQRKSSAFSNQMSPIQHRPFQVQKYIQVENN